jgi:hypothetical protein
MKPILGSYLASNRPTSQYDFSPEFGLTVSLLYTVLISSFSAKA